MPKEGKETVKKGIHDTPKGLFLVFFEEKASPNKTCRVLSLSGGGSKGAYEVGIYKTIYETFKNESSHYDVVSGVSVGAINTAGFGLYGPGEDGQLVDYLYNLWRNLESSDIWKMWDSWNPLLPIE